MTAQATCDVGGCRTSCRGRRNDRFPRPEPIRVCQRNVRERVLKAAAKLEYRPNMVARQLRSQRLSAIGVLLPDIANPFSTELVSGVKQVFDEAGYSTFIALSSRSVEQETASLRAFADHRVDGLIVATRGTKMGDEVLGISLVRVSQQSQSGVR